MKVLRDILLAFLLIGFFSFELSAQCETWVDSPKREEAENAHVLYREIVKDKQPADLAKLPKEEFDRVFSFWKTTYELAPAADGQRPSHFSDGRKLFRAQMDRATDAEKKAEYGERILGLYEQQMECYGNEAFLLGRKAFDMFYMPAYGFRETTLEAFDKALEAAGDQAEYILFDPLGQLVVYLYEADKLTKEEARDYNLRMNEIADYNVENNKRYGQYYESARKVMNSHFSKIEDEIFDCAYFKNKLLPQVEENPQDLEIIRYAYTKLKQQGCDTTDVQMVDLKGKYEALASEINAKLESDRRANNPGYDAAQLQKEGKYQEAVARYREAIKVAENDDAKAQYYYSIAFIQTWQFGQYGDARRNARKASDLKEGWGKPYILIGDMYAKSSRSCGDDWDSRIAILAAMEKYRYARSIDDAIADDANRRISQYYDAMPDRQEGFMRGIQEGQRVSVDCWIGETVTVKYK
ncbi:MAG: hypothetical protein R3350_01915 [Saprospiraceae bacterium]|nr:hypothetical protein [Saprospiraceae bacterium]